jgi:hypothetical protein
VTKLFLFVQAHWVNILAVATSLWIAVKNVANRIANSLPAPTKDATPRELWWFTFINNFAGNKERAKIPKVEDSPNFVAAAENYMRNRLASEAAAQQGQKMQ